jgi:PAS domain S-box-containing protein
MVKTEPDLYELLIRSVVDYAIYMLDLQGHIVSWNTGAQLIKGYTAEEILGKHFSCFYPEEDRLAGVPDHTLRSAATGGRFASEGWRVRKDGSRFWASVVVDTIHRDGKLVGFAKITRDMTEQRKAQLAALESERRFRLLVQGVTDYAIYMLDPDGYVTNWNAGAQHIKGYVAYEIVGQHFSRFYVEDDVAAGIPEKALAAARSIGRYEAEGWRRRKDGSRFWASVVVDAIHDDGQLIGFAKITRDLTERREIQLQLEQSREQLFHAQKMEAVGQLTGGLAHDFNNLLAGISGSLELVKKRVAQGRVDEIDRYITAAEGAVSRAAALTHRLLAFARRQTLDSKVIDPNTLIAGMADLIQRTIGPSIRLETVLAPSGGLISCDPNQLENAILNLCINARDAMPDGGRLSIATGQRLVEERTARELDMKTGDYVVISVTDTGTGMPPDVAKRAIEPFFTTKPTGRGTGLGLSMIYGFVKQSRGQLQIASEMGVGTTVSLYLPQHTGEAAKEVWQAHPPATPEVGNGETILIVDDEPTVGTLVVEVLAELGYSAIEAIDGSSGLMVLQSNVRIDLLITDVGLPGGMNGRQMADTARLSRPLLPVLFITGYAESTAIAEGDLEAGMYVLTKPFTIEALSSRVSGILKQG